VSENALRLVLFFVALAGFGVAPLIFGASLLKRTVRLRARLRVTSGRVAAVKQVIDSEDDKVYVLTVDFRSDAGQPLRCEAVSSVREFTAGQEVLFRYDPLKPLEGTADFSASMDFALGGFLFCFGLIVCFVFLTVGPASG
jgi:hypothetical protein